MKHAKPTVERPADIVIAADQADGRAYADKHGHNKSAIIVTPRSPYAARGRTGPVYATRRARLHHAYYSLLAECKPCGVTLPRQSRDRRVA